MSFTVRWKLSYDGEHDWEYLTPDGKWLTISVRVAQPCDPTKFNIGVYPHQIAGVGTVHKYMSFEGLPPAEAVEEIERQRREGYLEHLVHANKIGYPAERVPARLVPIKFDMETKMFVTSDGRAAHCQAEGFK